MSLTYVQTLTLLLGYYYLVLGLLLLVARDVNKAGSFKAKSLKAKARSLKAKG